jgi:CRP-like cAMP-binding protein
VFDTQKEENRVFWFVLMPEGPLTQLYNAVTAVAVIFAGFSIFLSIGFTQYLPPYNLFVFEKVVDGWFWADLALNFITAFYHNGKLVTHPGEIVMHYLQGWFLIDFLGDLPLESLLDFGQGKERKILKVLKFLKIPRLLRLARLRRVLQGKGKYVTLIVYVALALLAIHAAACMWMLALGPCSLFPPHCASDGTLCDWHYLEDIDPVLIVQDPLLGPECIPDAIGSVYAMALSYGASMVLGSGGIDIGNIDGGHYRTRELSIGSLTSSIANQSAATTLSSYDLIFSSAFPPNLFGQSFYANIWVLSVIIRILGFIGVAFLTAVIVKIELNSGYRETIFRRHVEALEAELHAAGAVIPDPLLRRIREHIAERWHSGEYGTSELQSTLLLSSQLKGEIIAALNKDVLMKVPFFRAATFEAIQLICQSGEERKYLPGELIFRRGEMSNGLYLIRSGTVLLSPWSSSWSNVKRTVATGDKRVLKEPQDDGTRPMRASYIRFRRRARTFRESFSTKVRRKVVDDWDGVFPVTSGSWFGECEVLREFVLETESDEVFRRTTTAEAKTVVNLLLIPKEAMKKVLLEYPIILQELLIAHMKRFNSADLPPALRASFRHGVAWEDRVIELIRQLSVPREPKDEDEFDEERINIPRTSRSAIFPSTDFSS